MKNEQEWELTANRFVAFFDILGFKELVNSQKHNEVLEKLNKLVISARKLKNIGHIQFFSERSISNDQTKFVTFSDSYIFFSKGDSKQDAMKILFDSYAIIISALKLGIPIKGSISYGEITVDFNNNLFFGKPIIDAYLLHEELQMLTVIIDNNFEVKLKLLSILEEENLFKNLLTNYKANLKCGKVHHMIIQPYNDLSNIRNHYELVQKLYDTVSGKPRIYLDNTIVFYEYLLAKLEKNTDDKHLNN